MKRPQGVREEATGVQKIKKPTQMMLVWVEFFIWGVHKEDTSLIWGYAEGYYFDLGVHKYHKVENP